MTDFSLASARLSVLKCISVLCADCTPNSTKRDYSWVFSSAADCSMRKQSAVISTSVEWRRRWWLAASWVTSCWLRFRSTRCLPTSSCCFTSSRCWTARSVCRPPVRVFYVCQTIHYHCHGNVWSNSLLIVRQWILIIVIMMWVVMSVSYFNCTFSISVCVFCWIIWFLILILVW